MNSRIRNLFLLPALLTGLGLMLAGPVTAQTLTTLYSFTARSGAHYANSDGAFPAPGLVSSGSALYGTAVFGGNSGNGTVFKINVDGTGFAVLHAFTATHDTASNTSVNNDGANPFGVVLSGNTIYGTAGLGGSSGNGTVYKVNTDGTGFEVLHNFGAVSGVTNSDGVRKTGWFYRATRFMGRCRRAVVLAMERFTRSTRMERGLRPYIVLPHCSMVHLVSMVPTVTDQVRKAD